MAMAVVTHASQEGSGGAAVSFTTGAGNLVLDSAVNSFPFLFSCSINAGTLFNKSIYMCPSVPASLALLNPY